MGRFKRVVSNGAPPGLVTFLMAYALTAYFAASAHRTYANALYAHVLPFVVSFTLWYFLARRQDLFLWRSGQRSIEHLLDMARVLFSWTILIVLLAVVFHPNELDITELAGFITAILLISVARPVLHFCAYNSHPYALVTLVTVLGGGIVAALLLSTVEQALLIENAVRGSPR